MVSSSAPRARRPGVHAVRSSAVRRFPPSPWVEAGRRRSAQPELGSTTDTGERPGRFGREHVIGDKVGIGSAQQCCDGRPAVPRLPTSASAWPSTATALAWTTVATRNVKAPVGHRAGGQERDQVGLPTRTLPVAPCSADEPDPDDQHGPQDRPARAPERDPHHDARGTRGHQRRDGIAIHEGIDTRHCRRPTIFERGSPAQPARSAGALR